MRSTCGLICLIGASIAYADHFPQEIGVLGDNYSDSGNSRPSTFGSQTAYTPLTDGTTWPVLLAQKLHAEKLLPSIQGGTNYAYVGALTSGTGTFPNPSLATQELSVKIHKSDPLFVFGGINDILQSVPGSEAAGNVSTILDTLHHDHYRTLVVFNLPDVGQFPAAGSSAADTTNTLLFNTTLLDDLQLKDYPVIAIDLYNLYEQIYANPESFGLVNSTSAPPLADPTAGYAFWYDGIDPSEATHRLIADYAYSVLTAAQCYATLAEFPFAVLREQRTGIYQQLAPMQHFHQKFFFYPFASGSYAPLLSPPLSDSCDSQEGHGGDITAGFTVRVWGGWTFGAAGSYATTYSQCREERNRCEFDLDTGILSLFAGWNHDRCYLNGIFNVAWLDYDKIERTFWTGSYRNKAHGHTSGMDYDAEIYGVYYIWSYPQTKIFARSHFRTGPLVTMNFQRILVDGYKEKGAKFGNLEFRGQGNTIFSTGLGWEAILDFNLASLELITDFHLAANRQWLSKERNIHFHERSLPGTDGSWPVRYPRNTYASGGIDFSLLFPFGTALSLGYGFNIGSFDMSEQVLTASITCPLGRKKQPPQPVKVLQHQGL